jgi:PAS domain S-box-containing protein
MENADAQLWPAPAPIARNAGGQARATGAAAFWVWVMTVAGAIVLASGLAVLAQAWAGMRPIAFGPGLPMKPNTALCFVLSGASLLLATAPRASWARRASQWLAAMVAGLALLYLLEYISGLNFGVDQASSALGITQSAFLPRRISAVSACCFVLFGAGVLAAGSRHQRLAAGYTLAAIAGFFASYLASLGFLYAVPMVTNPSPIYSISAQTAVTFLVLFVGLTALRPDLGWAAQLASPGAGGRLFRQLMPVVVLLLPGLGWLRVHGELAGFYGMRGGVTLFSTFNVTLLSLLLWVSARQADKLDSARRHSLARLSASETCLTETANRLQAATEQMRAVIEASPIAILAFDAQRNVTIWNRMAETVFGYTMAETIGRPISTRMRPDGSESTTRFARAEAGEVLRGLRTKLVHKNGRQVETISSLAGFFDGAGTLQGCVACVTDVTEYMALQSQLQQAQKMEAIGQLTGGLAHDFNNLLGVVLGNLDLLQERLAPDSEPYEMASAAIHAATRGAELTRQLLAATRQQPLAPLLTDLNQIMGGMARLLSRTIGGHISLELDIPEGLWPVLVDAAQLESAILNLAVNARDAMGQGGRLTLEARNVTLDAGNTELNPEAIPGAYVMIAISDTGSGMPAAVIARAFEPFFSTKGSGGSGLGLSMVHGFVKQSGGHTRIYSEVGQGTTIRIYLPRATLGAVELAESQQAEPQDESSICRGESILVVEDNQALRELAQRQLGELGYVTMAAENAVDALEIIRGTTPIDLLFTDVVMPGAMNGNALAREARALRPGLRVLFTSGFTATAAAAAIAAEFGSNLISKPYRKTELGSRVRATIDGAAGKIHPPP